jgi:8-oxo-dGTP pyrophosphatase MutT (NUDIX family)
LEKVYHTMDSYYVSLRKHVGKALLVIPSVAALFKNEKGEVLLVKKRGLNIWGFPAGAVEPTETVEQAVKREIFEETGIIAKIIKLRGVYSSPSIDFTYENGDKVHPIVFFFDCEIEKQEQFEGNDEIDELKYFSLDNLPKNMRSCCIEKAKDININVDDILLH